MYATWVMCRTGALSCNLQGLGCLGTTPGPNFLSLLGPDHAFPAIPDPPSPQTGGSGGWGSTPKTRKLYKLSKEISVSDLQSYCR